MKRSRILAAAGVALLMLGTGVAVGAAVGDDDGQPPSPPGTTSSAPTGRAHPGALAQQRYVPITPCRIVDTRVAGGKLAAGSTRSFVKVGSAAQGGTTCPIPDDASALEMSVTAVSAEGSGYLRLYPGVTEPQATFMNYSSHFNVANAGAVTVGFTNFTAKAYAKATHLVIDVFGYFIDGMWAQVSATGSLDSNSELVASATKLATGQYEVVFAREVEGCAATVSVGSHNSFSSTDGVASVSERFDNNNAVFVETKDYAGASVDRSFQVIVDC